MSADYWIHVLAQLALQHLWLGAVVVIPVLVVSLLRRRIGADACSWVLAVAFALAVAAPFAIFLPNHASSASSDPGWFSVATSSTPNLAGELLQPVAHTVATRASKPAVPHFFAIEFAAITIWLAGSAWMLYRLAAGWLVARRLLVFSRTRPDLERRFAHVLQNGTHLRVSECASGPMVVGLVRPCVLLPQHLIDELSPVELTFALRHELAHVRRRDPWLSLFQALALAAFWWSPFLWLLAVRLDAMREMACDERAAVQSDDVVACADALLKTAGKVSDFGRASAFAVGMLRNRTTLTERIEGLLRMNVTHRVSNKLVVTGCGMLALAAVSLAVLATPRVGAMQSAPASVAKVASANLADGDARLIEAAQAGNVDAIKRLVAQGVDVNARVAGDGTALIVAAKRGDIDTVNALIGLGANVNEAAPHDGNPLTGAAANGRLAVAKRLVAAGADVNAKVQFDETPLINAARSGGLPMVRYLAEQGADVNLGMVADWGRWRSPLNQASTDAIRQFLTSKGAVERK